MGVGQIKHVDIVAHCRSIARVVVIAEDREVRPLTQGNLDRNWDGVGLGLVPLAAANLQGERRPEWMACRENHGAAWATRFAPALNMQV